MMNVLILGGFNNKYIDLIDVLLKNSNPINIIIVDNYQFLHQNKNAHIRLYERFGYLESTNLFFYRLSCNDISTMEHIFKKHKITHIINNIKHNMKLDFDENFNNLVNGYKDLLSLSQRYSIQLILNIQRTFSCDHICLNETMYKENLHKESVFFEKERNLLNTMYSDLNIQSISYKDYLYGDRMNYNHDIIFKLYYYTRRNMLLHTLDINSYFSSVKELNATIVMKLLFDEYKSKDRIIPHKELSSIRMNFKETILTIINGFLNDDCLLHMYEYMDIIVYVRKIHREYDPNLIIPF